MRPSENIFNRFEDALWIHVMLHGRERVTTGLGQKYIYPPRAFVRRRLEQGMHAHLRPGHSHWFLEGISSQEHFWHSAPDDWSPAFDTRMQ
jgi:hypothetical protein